MRKRLPENPQEEKPERASILNTITRNHRNTVKYTRDLEIYSFWLQSRVGEHFCHVVL